MERKVWEKPVTVVQKFVPNEYVAACYKIKCTTPQHNATFYYLYDDSNHNGTWDDGDRLLYSNGWGGFSGCNRWHKGVIRDNPPEENGFVTRGRNPKWDKAYSVFWWNERLGADSDYHVMTPGNENYESNPNAS
ncbi:MAG TPA: hypothetical protein H9913_13105 [Candidatus Blautia stercoripullorum]|uniref:Uncharacterized protein n=1 Tax=Candidatus Blautia stercoripullorum TaxID=2838502 RepID=A0A9D2R9I9_9FIRM|nr:hypothetical protein [Candidatus Blautia stercoripullorum]